MKQAAILLGVAATLSGTLFAAQLYRWVDEKGNVEFRDTPPPASVPSKSIQQRSVSGSSTDTSTLPYAVQVAAKNFPVTLWASNCGVACDQAKAHLARRGVPHEEKDPTADVDAFQKLTGSNEVPVLVVGRTQIKGYLASTYDNALDSAGYPRSAPPIAKPSAKPAATAKAGESADKTAEKPAEKPAAKPAASGAQAVRLFTHPQCGNPCDDARTLLNGRGVAFQEVSADSADGLAELEKISGGRNVPVMVVGQSVVRGFADTNYHQALDDAGFRRP
jgi:glutaredoxin